MKKFRLSLLCTILLTSLFTSLLVIQPKAALVGDTYGWACGNALYSADYINDDGSFRNLACSNDSGSLMKYLYEDNVIRYRDSKSPTKIVMMSGGLVYSYPFRLGKNTLDVTGYDNSTSTYVTYHREMLYGWTESMYSVVVTLNGYVGRVSMDGVDLIPWKYIRNNIPITLGGNDITAQNEQPFKTYIKQSYYTVYESNYGKNLRFTWSSGWSENGNPATYSHELGPVDSSIAPGNYYSYDGYNFYSNRECTQLAFTYYNYYQYLPMRSKTNYTADQLNAFIDYKVNGRHSVLTGKGQAFIDAQNTYGVNAALVLAIACLESAYGTSSYAVNRNNLFGLAAYDSNPDSATTFSSVEECINQMMGYYLKDWMDIKDYRFFGMHLGNKGSGVNVKYAADPYWGIKIGSIYYELDAYCGGSQLKDYGSVSRGLVTTHNAAVKASASGSSTTYFSTANKYGYQSAFIIPILGEENGYYKFQCNNKIENGGIVSNGYVTYDWNASQTYINKNDVSVINGTIVVGDTNEGKVPTGDFYQDAVMSWNEDALVIKGTAYRPGIKVTETNTIAHQLTIIDSYFMGNEAKTTTTVADDSMVGSYEATIDVTTYDLGTYKFYVNTTYGELSEYNNVDEFIDNVDPLPETKVIDDKQYSFSLDKSGNVEMLVSQVGTSLPETDDEEDKDDTAELHNLQYGFYTFEYDEETNILSTSGITYITNVNALETDADKIKLGINLVDRETEEKYPLDVTLSKSDDPSYSGNYLYEYIDFAGSISLDSLPNSVFTVEIILSNSSGEETITRSSIVTYNKVLEEAIYYDQENALEISINKNSNYLNRFEISKQKVEIDTSKLNNKPTTLETFASIATYDLNEENKTLSINGYSFMYGFDLTGDRIATGTVYLVDLATGKMYANDVEFIKSDTPLSQTRGYVVTNAEFNTTIDLRNIPSGSYKVMLAQEVRIDDKTTYSSFDELTGTRIEEKTLSDDLTSIIVYRSLIRNRMQLEVTSVDTNKLDVENELTVSETIEPTVEATSDTIDVNAESESDSKQSSVYVSDDIEFNLISQYLPIGSDE